MALLNHEVALPFRPHIYVYTLTSAHLHLHALTSADLPLYLHTPAHLHVYNYINHTCTSTLSLPSLFLFLHSFTFKAGLAYRLCCGGRTGLRWRGGCPWSSWRRGGQQDTAAHNPPWPRVGMRFVVGALGATPAQTCCAASTPPGKVASSDIFGQGLISYAPSQLICRGCSSSFAATKRMAQPSMLLASSRRAPRRSSCSITPTPFRQGAQSFLSSLFVELASGCLRAHHLAFDPFAHYPVAGWRLCGGGPRPAQFLRR